MQTEQLQQIELEYREGSSDKVYRAAIEEAQGGYVVNFAYGRRGATLNTGTKTTSPVPYDEALIIYGKLVRSKTAKGYKPVGNTGAGIGTSVTSRERLDTGLRAQLLNPITEDQAEAYLTDDNWCAQEKYDGRRMLVRKTGDEIVAANRDGLCTGFPTALATQLSGVRGSFVIDGESVGENFYAFDLLEGAGGDWRQSPYRIRLEALDSQLGSLGGNIRVAPTTTGQAKRSFLAELKAAGKEGIVFKDLRAGWQAGRPSSGGRALKCKFWASCSCVVAKVNARRSVELALGDQSVGNVTIPPNHKMPAAGQVVEIRYLYVVGAGGSLYQPIYLGVRDDVPAEDCTVERQRLKYRSMEE